MSWKFINSTAVGSSHILANTPCQDACLVEVGEDYLLIAVSDGAGTAKRSIEGASLAVKTVVDYLSNELKQRANLSIDENYWQELILKAYKKVSDEINALAKEDDSQNKDFSATLTVVVQLNEWLVAGQIGDGVVVIEDASGVLRRFTTPQHGEYANETNFITNDSIDSILEISLCREKIVSIAVLTDGLIRLAVSRQDNSPFIRFFQPIFEYARSVEDTTAGNLQLSEFLNSEKVLSKTDDDKCLVIAVKKEPATPSII